MEPSKSSPLLNIPMAILIAGAIIAGAVIYTKSPSSSSRPTDVKTTFGEQFKAVSADDHIKGNPNAKVKIVEYSDASCPFCKSFHNTMNRIISDYGLTGDVAWVYRHYPLNRPLPDGSIFHPNAGKEAEAMECAGDQGGNEKFWQFTDKLYEVTPSVTGNTPNGLSQSELPKIASTIGLNVDSFNNCLSTGKFTSKVESDFTDGVNIGIQGTPASVMVLSKAFPSSIKEKLMQIYEPYKNQQTGEYPISISSDSKMVMIGGAMPYETMKATIDLMFTY